MSGHEQRPGDHLVICDYSGFKVWASETVKTWNGFRVHRRFVGEEQQRHPQDLIRPVPERVGVPNGRPEATDDFLTVNEVTASSL